MKTIGELISEKKELTKTIDLTCIGDNEEKYSEIKKIRKDVHKHIQTDENINKRKSMITDELIVYYVKEVLNFNCSKHYHKFSKLKIIGSGSGSGDESRVLSAIAYDKKTEHSVNIAIKVIFSIVDKYLPNIWTEVVYTYLIGEEGIGARMYDAFNIMIGQDKNGKNIYDQFIIMELMDGDCYHYIKSITFSPEQKQKCIQQILDKLNLLYNHLKLGCMDIKLSNFGYILDKNRDPIVKILDFGIDYCSPDKMNDSKYVIGLFMVVIMILFITTSEILKRISSTIEQNKIVYKPFCDSDIFQRIGKGDNIDKLFNNIVEKNDDLKKLFSWYLYNDQNNLVKIDEFKQEYIYLKYLCEKN